MWIVDRGKNLLFPTIPRSTIHNPQSTVYFFPLRLTIHFWVRLLLRVL